MQGWGDAPNNVVANEAGEDENHEVENEGVCTAAGLQLQLANLRRQRFGIFS